MGSSVSDPYGSLAEAPARFDASTDLTLAIEEEFQILDRETLSLRNGFRELQALADGTPLERAPRGRADRVRGRGQDRALRDVRGGRAARRSSAGASSTRSSTGSASSCCVDCGTHPWSPWTEQRIIDTPHYRLVEESLRYVAWRNNTFGIHVHVGVQGADRAIELMNRAALDPAPTCSR